ncbi:hypothetical protein [Kitasatospora fiedleri]|uniref:hypothetical protein n=1 Tax=Kitasatospora fiedleri TaxID=2991545 RepID=UPI002499E8DF|nr:hypothetical protein [Kitasatospora fiedleri]
MRAADSVKALMVGSDPAADLVDDPVRRRQDLARILAEPQDAAAPRARAGVRRRRFLVPLGGLAVAASAALVLTLLLPTGPSGTAYAATPPPLSYRSASTDVPAPRLLADIAQRIDTLVEPDGPDAVLEWRDWSLFTRVDGRTVSSKVVAEDHRAVFHTDGSGTRTHGIDGGSPTTEPYQRGLYRDPVPADPTLLRAALREATPAVDTASGLDQAVGGVLRTQALGPAQRAAVLELIADLPGLRYDGSVTDRAGRQGEAFSADGDGSGLPTRYTFIVEATSGRVLGQEETLTTRAGSLNVPVPSVIGYTVYLSSGRQ